MGEAKTGVKELMETARLLCDRGDYLLAVDKLKVAAEQFEARREWPLFLECQNLLLRLFAELEDPKSVNAIKEKLQDLVLRENVDLSSKTYYTLALCASFKGQSKVALDYLEKALALALAADDKKDICYAIYGLSLIYFKLGRFEDALKEIYNLQVFFQVLDLPELKLSSEIMNGQILRKLGKPERALEIFWQAYEGLKMHKNMTLYISVLYALGVTYAESGDVDLGRTYLSLARKTVDADNLKWTARNLDEALSQLGGKQESKYDIVLRTQSNAVVERKRGPIDFKNQFVLLDMLKVFLKNPGQVYTKEALVNVVWRQQYDPSVHDNKIYVTIKRLRKMIEPDFEKPRYIFRAKNGYYLNKNTKVLIEQ